MRLGEQISPRELVWSNSNNGCIFYIIWKYIFSPFYVASAVYAWRLEIIIYCVSYFRIVLHAQNCMGDFAKTIVARCYTILFYLRVRLTS